VIDIIIPTCKNPDEVLTLKEEIFLTAGDECRVFATCAPVSAPKNRNRGLALADSDPFCMVDDDVFGLPQGWAVRLAEVLRQHPEAVMVSAQLAALDGKPGQMMGGFRAQREGVSEAAQKKLPPACVAIRRNPVRFCEEYIGSGWEDDDYCARLRVLYPHAQFLVCHDVWVTHANEQKNQQGQFWEHNRAVFLRIWGSHANPDIGRYSKEAMPA
jgi:hypothetical protein